MPMESAESLDDGQAALAEVVAELSEEERARCFELGAFRAGVRVPTRFVAGLWRGRAGLAAAAARRLWVRLAELSAGRVSGADAPAVVVERGHLTVSEAARKFFRGRLSRDDRVAISGALVDAAMAELPRDGDSGGPVRWWELDRRNAYLWDHLVLHMVEAGREEQARALLLDPRWAVARVRRSGMDAFTEDLHMAASPPGLSAQEPANLITELENVMEAERFNPTGDRGAVELLGVLSSTRDGRAKLAAIQENLGRPLLIDRWLPREPDEVDPGGRMLAVAPDGTWFATVERSREQSITRMWDVAAGTRDTLRTNRGEGLRAFAPDRSWFVRGRPDNTFQVWDLAKKECVQVLTGHTDGTRDAKVAPDGSWLVTSDAGGVLRVWDTATWECVRVITGPDTLGGPIVMAPNGRYLFVAYEGARNTFTTHVLDTQTWTTSHELDSPGGYGLMQAIPSADGSRVALRTSGGMKAQVWSSQTGRLLRTARQSSRLWGQMTLSPDGKVLVVIFGDDRVRIFDVAGTGKPRMLPRYDARVSGLEVSPDSRWLATADKRALRVWDISTAECVAKIQMDAPVNGCTWLPGNLLAAVGKGGTNLYELRLP